MNKEKMKKTKLFEPIEEEICKFIYKKRNKLTNIHLLTENIDIVPIPNYGDFVVIERSNVKLPKVSKFSLLWELKKGTLKYAGKNGKIIRSNDNLLIVLFKFNNIKWFSNEKTKGGKK